MAERLEQVAQHLVTVNELSEVIAAMRGIAAARAREARQSLEGVRAYAETLGTAIGEALALLDTAAPSAPGATPATGLAVVLSTEQGFVGNLGDRLLAEVADTPGLADAGLLLVGERGRQRAGEHHLAPEWTAPMAAHLEEIPGLADRLGEAIHARLGDTPLTVSLLHARPGDTGEPPPVTRRTLLPFDYSRFPVSRRRAPPATHLDATTLVEALADEYLYAELHEAILLAFVAENEARLSAMIAAQSHLDTRRETLLGDYHRARQEAITEEIITLAASRL